MNVVCIVSILLFIILGWIYFRREGFQSQSGSLAAVRFVQLTSTTYLQISQLQVFSGGENVALGKTATSTSEIGQGMTAFPIDGTESARAFPNLYMSNDITSTWSVELGQAFIVDKIVSYNRLDADQSRAQSMLMTLFDASNNVVGQPIQFTSADEIQSFSFKPVVSAVSPETSVTGSLCVASTPASVGVTETRPPISVSSSGIS